MVEGNGWWICVQNFKSISSKMAEIWHKTCQNRHFSRHFGTLPWFSEFYFLTDFDASKSVLGSFFAFFAKISPKNMYRSSKSRNFFAWSFLPGDLTWPWPLLWSWSTVNDTYKCQRRRPHFHGHLKPSVRRSVVCSRACLVSMGTLKPPYSRSVVWSRLRCPSKHP